MPRFGPQFPKSAGDVSQAADCLLFRVQCFESRSLAAPCQEVPTDEGNRMDEAARPRWLSRGRVRRRSGSLANVGGSRFLTDSSNRFGMTSLRVVARLPTKNVVYAAPVRNDIGKARRLHRRSFTRAPHPLERRSLREERVYTIRSRTARLAKRLASTLSSRGT